MYRSAFTIAEFAYLLIIFTIVFIAFIIGNKMILKSRLTSIIIESGIYKNAIIKFYHRYQCLPGDCSEKLMKEVLKDYPEINKNCSYFRDRSFVSETNKINVPAKRTCAFWQLRATNLTPDNIDMSRINSVSISQSITGITMPPVNKNPHLSWQIITVGRDEAGNYSLPLFLNKTINNNVDIVNFAGKTTLVITNSSDKEYQDLSNSNWPVLLESRMDRRIGKVTVKEAAYIDKKIDTGIPSIGSFLSDRDIIDLGENNSQDGCWIINEKHDPYLPGSQEIIYNIKKENHKCIVAFLIPDLLLS